MKPQRRSRDTCSSTLSLTSVLVGVGGQRQEPVALSPGRSSGTRCAEGWLESRAGLDGSGKSRLHRDLIPGTVQPVAGRYSQLAFLKYFK